MIPLVIFLRAAVPFGWVVLGALLLAGLAAWSYRWTRPPVGPARRAVLALLRAFALVAVWALLTGVELHWRVESPARTRVAVLLDRSASMGFTDPRGDRDEVVRELLANPVWKAVNRQARLQRFTFSDALRPWTKKNPPGPTGPVTDLAAALGELARRPEGPPDAVLLISDGAFNQGGSGAAEARKLGVPMFAVAVGDSLPPKDLVLSGVVGPEVAYVGESVPLDVTLRAAGAGGDSSVVTVLADDGRTVAADTVHFAGNWSETTLRFDVIPETAGVASWRVGVRTLEGERSVENNSRRVAVRVARRRRTVLLLAGSPSPDAASFARVLESDKDTDAKIVIGGGRMRRPVRGSWPDAGALEEVDAAILLLQAPFGDRARKAVEAVLAANLPLTVITGDDPDRSTLAALAPRIGGFRPAGGQAVEAPLLPRREHPLFTTGGSWFTDPPSPPPVVVPPLLALGGTALASAQTDPERPAVLVTGTRPRTLLVLAGGLWRWDLSRRPFDPTGRGFRELVGRVLRWLTAGEEEQRIVVKPARDLFAGGEEIELIAEVRDEGLRPVDDAAVEGVLRHGGEERRIDFQPLGAGRYRARTAPWGEGKYEYRAEVRTGGETADRGGEFVVDRFRLEEAELRMRPDRLRAVARATGGRVIFPSQVEALPDLLPAKKGREEIRGRWRPFGLWSTLLAVVLLLAAEWFIRTRRGMV